MLQCLYGQKDHLLHNKNAPPNIFLISYMVYFIYSALDLGFKKMHFCTLDVCPSPPRLVHGSHDGNDFSNGRNVTYSCDPSYVLEGSDVMECLDGKWLGQIPVCRGNEKGQSMMYNRRLLIFVGLSHCTASADTR